MQPYQRASLILFRPTPAGLPFRVSVRYPRARRAPVHSLVMLFIQGDPEVLLQTLEADLSLQTTPWSSYSRVQPSWPVPWPPCSPDLNALHFHLQGHLKQLAYTAHTMIG